MTFLVVACVCEVKWAIGESKKKFNAEASALGPEDGMEKEVSFLNRKI